MPMLGERCTGCYGYQALLRQIISYRFSGTKLQLYRWLIWPARAQEYEV